MTKTAKILGCAAIAANAIGMAHFTALISQICSVASGILIGWMLFLGMTPPVVASKKASYVTYGSRPFLDEFHLVFGAMIAGFAFGFSRPFIPFHPLSLDGSYQAFAHIFVGYCVAAICFSSDRKIYAWILGLLTIEELICGFLKL
jgi:hypothetical protein